MRINANRPCEIYPMHLLAETTRGYWIIASRGTVDIYATQFHKLDKNGRIVQTAPLNPRKIVSKTLFKPI